MRNKTAYRMLCDEKENESAVPVYIQLTLGALGNILAVVLLWLSRHEHKWQSFYVLFSGLVMTDLIHNCVCYPLVLQRYISHFTWCFPEEICDLFSFMEAFFHLASGLTIGVMTVDRYLHMKNKRQRISRFNYVTLFCSLLIISGVISSLQLIGVGNSQLFYPGSWCFLDFTSRSVGNKINAFIYSLTGIIIMLVTIVIGLITILMTCRSNEHQALLLDNQLVSGIYDSHVTKFLVISMFTFVLLWGPLLIDILLHATDLTTSNNRKELWLVRLMYLNTQINPWLYVILRRESVRRFFVLSLRCRRQCCSGDEGNEQYNEEVHNFVRDDDDDDEGFSSS
ncbi:prostaglandin E2 receptor EP2 subtype-like [Saccostrea echinata]|uniref:prostaglandin E2 receptor EP2 subtype-like n=1 Tax=Saccostrea echinata TaxID=191078 RepID=UPI002A80C093|nr:prostaglandin E2 receptor EP2 subtype-like [Saccostrea echinata]